jgi:hypothetical protein
MPESMCQLLRCSQAVNSCSVCLAALPLKLPGTLLVRGLECLEDRSGTGPKVYLKNCEASNWSAMCVGNVGPQFRQLEEVPRVYCGCACSTPRPDVALLSVSCPR